MGILNRDNGNSPTRYEIDYIMMNHVMTNIDNIFAHLRCFYFRYFHTYLSQNGKAIIRLDKKLNLQDIPKWP